MQCASSTTNRAKFPYSINKTDFGDIAIETAEEDLEARVQLEQLGREVEEFQTRRIGFGAGAEFLVHLVFHRAWLRVKRNNEPYTVATQVSTWNAAAGAFQQGFDLVLEEGKKRTEDDGNAFGEDGGNLEAQAFPATRALQHEHVVSREGRGDDFALVVAVGWVLEHVAEREV